MNTCDLKDVSHIPFLKELGIELVGMEGGQAQLALALTPDHMNSWQCAHGGITMTLLDAVMSMAGRSLDTQSRAGVTVEMKTSFLRPAGKAGERLVAKGLVLHRSATLCFCEGEVWNEDNLIAKAMGTFKYLKHRRSDRKPGLPASQEPGHFVD